MTEWMDGPVDRWMDGWTDEQMNKGTNRRTDSKTVVPRQRLRGSSRDTFEEVDSSPIRECGGRGFIIALVSIFVLMSIRGP